MKKILLLSAAFCFLFLNSFSQTDPVLNFTSKIVDKGAVALNSTLEHSFSFTNSGTSDLAVTSATTTNPNASIVFTKNVVAAGETGSVQLTLPISAHGDFSIDIIVSSNDPSGNQTLTLTGTTLRKKKTEVQGFQAK